MRKNYNGVYETKPPVKWLPPDDCIDCPDIEPANGKFETKPPVYPPGYVDTESGFMVAPGQLHPIWIVAGVVGLLWYFGS